MVLLSRLATPIVPSDVRPRRARATRRAGRWPAMALACAMAALPLTGRALFGQAAPAPAPTPATGQPSTAPPPAPANGAQPTTPAAGQPAAGQPAAGQPAAPAPAQPGAPTAAPPAAAGAQPPGAQPAAAGAQPQAPATLKGAVEDFWFEAKIARYDLAVNEANRILAIGAQPVEVLEAFEQTAQARHDDLFEWLNRWLQVPQMQNAAQQILGVLNQGSFARKSDPNFIRSSIERLTINERAYGIAINRLRQSGELAVPFMLEYLRDPARSQFAPGVRRALRDLGRQALNPLVAATETKDNDLLISVITALGDMHYNDVAPYIARVLQRPDAANTAKEAAVRSLGSLGIDPRNLDVAQMYYQLGEKIYYGRSDITQDPRNPAAFIWYWSEDRGLHKLDVPQQIWAPLMTMRETEYSLKTGGSNADALSLWLAANYRREVQLPEGQKDPTRAENQPDANYYGVTSGAQYLNQALARALRDGDSPVCMKIIASLQEIAGQSNLFGGQGQQAQAGSPLIDAMSYPDRLVRFEAAFALAGALPQQRFFGSERVVPLLAEAISQTGQPSVVVAMANQDQTNGAVQALKQNNAMVAEGATSAETAVGAANKLAAVDVIVISEDLGPEQVSRLLQLGSTNPKLQGAAKLIITKTAASPWVERAATDKSISVAQAPDVAALRAAVEQARAKAGALALNGDVATKYALRAGQLLKQLAIARGQVMDVGVARPALLSALDDARPDIIRLAGEALGLINHPDAQAGLLTKAMAEQTPDDLRISLYRSLATNAKFFGNQLQQQQVQQLSQVVAQAQNLDVRSAAADARGALNLPADQAKQLVVDQSRV